jgi:two-component system chemotaxis response regulator CheB
LPIATATMRFHAEEAAAMRDEVHAIPPDATEPGKTRFTALTCAACPGALTVKAEGRGHLVFECRIGHVYTLGELLAVKERCVEEMHWNAVEALEELAALLEDSGSDVVRAARTREHAAALRCLIEVADPIELSMRQQPGSCDGGSGA